MPDGAYAPPEGLHAELVLITAAGASSRFGGDKKEFMSAGGMSVLERAARAFLQPGPDGSLPAGMVITATPGRESEARAALSAQALAALESLVPCGFAVVPGGADRRDSVRLGLEELARRALSAGLDSDRCIVHVHDGARPWVTPELVRACSRVAREHGACVPVTPLVDTPKELGDDGLLRSHPGRGGFGGAQTPQSFVLGPLLAAHRKAAGENWTCTDDASVWDRYIGPVSWVEGERENRKVTYREDLMQDRERAMEPADPMQALRVGEGWDIHRLAEGRALVVGGVVVPFERGELGHSDGDVLWHAVIDALFGAISMGDIGTHFPPSDMRWKDADSSDLARQAMRLVRDAGWELVNLDTTVTLERPRLGPHREAILASLSSVLGTDLSRVSLKAKTKEGMDSVGSGDAIEARAVALLHRAVR